MLVLLFVAVLCSAGHAKVNLFSNSGFEHFKECKKKFFIGGTPPSGFITQDQILRQVVSGDKFGAEICQKYENAYHYATLYRTDLRIPVYSAYKVRTEEREKEPKCPQSRTWKYESGFLTLKFRGTLKFRADNTNMLPLGKIDIEEIKSFMAIDSDYEYIVGGLNIGSVFDKGHLYPNLYASYNTINPIISRASTYTMTNQAPMNPCLNSGIWKKAEHELLKFMIKSCPHGDYENYFLTGTGFIENKVKHQIPPADNAGDKSRVAVPDFFWTAACCMHRKTSKGFGVAYRSDGNNGDSTVVAINVPRLETYLSSHMSPQSTQIKLFPGNNPCANGNHEEAKRFITDMNTIAESIKRARDMPKGRKREKSQETPRNHKKSRGNP